MRAVAMCALLLVALALMGCQGAGLYSRQEYEPRAVAGGETLDTLVVNNGPPDVQGWVGDYHLLGWKGSEGLSFWDRILTGLPFFGKGSKPNFVALADRNGKIITARGGSPGSQLTILGVFAAPVFTVESKR